MAAILGTIAVIGLIGGLMVIIAWLNSPPGY
jgi:hypothetical protein